MFNREGQSFGMYPLRIIWLETTLNTSFPAQFALSVPKKKFKKAVVRNRIRRQVREAYRLHKHQLYEFLEQKDMQCAIMVLYTGKEMATYWEIEKKIKLMIRRFIKIQHRLAKKK